MVLYINRDELLELYANMDELDISNYDIKVAVVRQNILDMPTIDVVRCKDCKHSNNCTYPAKWNWCPDGERKTDYTVFTVNMPKGIETPLKGDATVFHKNSKITQIKGE